MAYTIGEGIANKMAELGDEPATDEHYYPPGDHWEWSDTYGTSGRRYVYIRSLNRVVVHDPKA